MCWADMVEDRWGSGGEYDHISLNICMKFSGVKEDAQNKKEIDNSQPKINFKSRIGFVTQVLRKDIMYFNQ